MEVQLTVLLLLAVLLLSASAQTCEPFAGSPTYCDCLTDYDVYIPPGVTQATLASTLLADLPENLVPFIPSDCRDDTLLMSCATAFRKCNNSDPLVPPLPMCYATCTTFNSVCAAALAIGGKQPINCTQTDALSGAALFQNTSDCSNPAPSAACSPVAPSGCPTYFVINIEKTECIPSCNFPPFADKQRNKITQNIFRYILPLSMAMEVVLCITWLIVWDPQRPLYVAFFMGGLFVQHFAFFIGKWNSFESWQCSDVYTLRTQGNTGCAIQGFLALLGTYTPIAWIGIILYHLFNSVTQQRYQIIGEGRLIPLNPNFVYHGFVWGMGLILTAMPFILDEINALAGYVCYPDPTLNDGMFLYGLLFTPLTIMVIIEIFLTIALFVFIFKLAGFAGLRTQGRLTLLCTYYLLTTSYLVFNAWDVFRKRHDTADGVRAHIECVVQNFGRGWVTNDTAGCPSAPVFNDNKELLGEVLVAIDGLLIGLILLDPKLLKVAYSSVSHTVSGGGSSLTIDPSRGSASSERLSRL